MSHLFTGCQPRSVGGAMGMIVGVLCGFSVTFLAQRATGQNPGDQTPGLGNAPANAVTEFSGSLKGMQGHMVMVEKEDGGQALVAVPDSITSFQFVAKASPAFLRRGMLMRFVANFGPGGVPLTPVSTVTLFQSVNPKMLHGRAREQFTPGIYSQTPKNPKMRNMPMSGKLTIVGQFIGLNPNGVLAVQAGRVPVRVPVDTSTKLEIRYNNLSLAQPGDAITVSGFYEPPNENQVKASKITVTTDRVYGEYQEEPKRSPSRRSRRRTENAKPAEADGDGKEAGEEAMFGDKDKPAGDEGGVKAEDL